MNIRKQKNKDREVWSIEQIKSGLLKFYEENNHYPTATEVDDYEYLPSSRSIQRSFGGLVNLRKELNIGDNYDLRSGAYSSARAIKINQRGNIVENEVNEFLIKKYGKEFVHREYFFTDDRRTRADFFVYTKGSSFCIDVFYPSDTRNLTGCLNSKLDKYKSNYMRQYPIIFLQMNKDISDDLLNKIINNKAKKLPEGQHLMSWEQFKEFCDKKRPIILKD